MESKSIKSSKTTAIELNCELTGSPFEYENDILCVRARYLISGISADNESLQLIGERGLQKRIEKGNIKRVRKPGPNSPMLVNFETLPSSWKKILIRAFGEPEKKVRKSIFEKHYERDLSAYEYFINYRLEDGKVLPHEIVDEYTLNASVLNCVKLVHTKRLEMRISLRGSTRGTWQTVSSNCNRFKSIKPHTLPESSTALQRKLNEYKKEGYQSIIHGNWSNKSALKVDDNVIGILNSLFASQKTKPTATDVFRQYEGFLGGYVEVISNETGKIKSELIR